MLKALRNGTIEAVVGDAPHLLVMARNEPNTFMVHTCTYYPAAGVDPTDCSVFF